MRSLVSDLGGSCASDVYDLLEELIVTVVNSAKTATDNEQFAQYRTELNSEYADSIYQTISRYKRIKRRQK